MYTILTSYGWKCAWIALFLGLASNSTSFSASAQTPPPLPNAIQMAGSSLTLTQSVTVSVQEINEITISSDVSLTIDTATPGTGPDAANDASASFNLTTNGTNKKIVGALDSNFSSGISLKALLVAPTGGSSSEQTLSNVAVDLVNGITRTTATNLSITYTAEATINAAPNGSGESRTVTLTLMDN